MTPADNTTQTMSVAEALANKHHRPANSAPLPNKPIRQHDVDVELCQAGDYDGDSTHISRNKNTKSPLGKRRQVSRARKAFAAVSRRKNR